MPIVTTMDAIHAFCSAAGIHNADDVARGERFQRHGLSFAMRRVPQDAADALYIFCELQEWPHGSPVVADRWMLAQNVRLHAGCASQRFRISSYSSGGNAFHGATCRITGSGDAFDSAVASKWVASRVRFDGVKGHERFLMIGEEILCVQ